MKSLTPTIGAGGLIRSPAFTLATALSWLGHECRGICPALAGEWRSEVWYLPLSEPESRRHHTLVEVDFTGCPWSASTIRTLLRDVNRCVHPGRIRVRERNSHQPSE